MLRVFVATVAAVAAISTQMGCAVGMRGSGAPALGQPKTLSAESELVRLERIALPRESRAVHLRCGGRSASLEIVNDTMRLTVGEETYDMRPVVTASGVTYEAIDDPSTTFWSKGDRARLVVRGRPYPECARIDTSAPVFRAGGNEPGWRLEITDTTMTLLADNGGTRIVAPTPVPDAAGDDRTYAASTSGGSLTVTVFDRLCDDTMTGMPHPAAVVVAYAGGTLEGCGGDPAALLRGDEWAVEDLAGAAVVGGSRITINFRDDGRLSGRASCNEYAGEYSFTGEGLAISKTVRTKKLCEPSLMRQEEAFLELLENVRMFSLRPDGALVLHTGDGRAMTARRE